ncbi:unnamed protein product [Ilex paraguariensis]|uniref:Uncharacterized protein n=1 Tax=Ilex paraguariensis TaxID=185542 RepID=A0ABC8SNJ2_9AQUA
MMMSSSCIAGCLDAQAPVELSLVKLHQWAQADREFLRMVTMNRDTQSSSSSSPILSSPSRGKSYACRQRYLRSYTFSKKESPAQRTKKWLTEKKKQKKENSNGGSGTGSCSFLDVVFKLLFVCVAKVDVHEF